MIARTSLARQKLPGVHLMRTMRASAVEPEATAAVIMLANDKKTLVKNERKYVGHANRHVGDIPTRLAYDGKSAAAQSSVVQRVARKVRRDITSSPASMHELNMTHTKYFLGSQGIKDLL
ncbi:unnamed protein product [Ceratitis capitata]|uniref:(Mediterranean fruit fly) hypothetical protein n=1 Tax=Ceratitis capitata TaxID=7213 RepID=A0A811VEY2_CERCA|nr:unnamed protein product [Ceratitis capitata]